MLKNIVLFIIIALISYGAYMFFNQFVDTARKSAEDSLSVPQIGTIIKGAKGLQKQSEENLKRYDEPSKDD